MPNYYHIGNEVPREVYLRGREVFDLSRLREKPVMGPKEGELEETDNDRQAGEMPAEVDVFNSDVNVQLEEKAAPRTQGTEEFARQERPGETLEDKLLEKPEASEKPVNLKEPITLTILHTNDLHGNLLPRQDITDFRHPEQKASVGGEAAISAVISRERQEAKDRGENLMLLDAGDFAMGTSISGLFEGKPMVEVMNRQGYDAATLGNHDFDWGMDALKNMIQQADFPFLAANIKDEFGKPLPNVQPFMIKELPGMKVGLVGVANPETKSLNVRDDIKNLDFNDPIASLKATIPEMKRQGAEMIIVLSHAGLDEDKKLAEEVKGIDLIVGGHTHDTLEKPLQVGKTLVVQTGYGGKNVGKVQLQWDPEKKSVIKGDGKLIPINTEEIYPDMEVTSIIEGYSKKLDSIMNVRVGKSIDDLVQPRHGEETDLGNLVTDIIRDKMGADMALLNSGCIRTNLVKGDIKFRDIYDVLPFDSKIVKMKMKGEDIIKALEQSAGQESGDKSLQVSGLKIKYDSTRPEGSRLVEIVMENGEPIDPGRTYDVASTDYLAKGGDNYDVFARGDQVDRDNNPLYQSVADQVRVKGVLSSRGLGRFQDIA